MTDISQPKVEETYSSTQKIPSLANVNYGVPFLKATLLDFTTACIMQKYTGTPSSISPIFSGALAATSYTIRDIAREFEHQYLGGLAGGAFKYGTIAFINLSAMGLATSLGGMLIIGFASTIGGLNHASYEYDRDNNLGQYSEKFSIGFASAVEGTDSFLMSPVSAYTKASTIKTITYTVSPTIAELKAKQITQLLRTKTSLDLTKGVVANEVTKYQPADFNDFYTTLKSTNLLARFLEGAAVGGLVSIIANNAYVTLLPYVEDYKKTGKTITDFITSNKDLNTPVIDFSNKALNLAKSATEFISFCAQPYIDKVFDTLSGNAHSHEEL